MCCCLTELGRRPRYKAKWVLTLPLEHLGEERSCLKGPQVLLCTSSVFDRADEQVPFRTEDPQVSLLIPRR